MKKNTSDGHVVFNRKKIVLKAGVSSFKGEAMNKRISSMSLAIFLSAVMVFTLIPGISGSYISATENDPPVTQEESVDSGENNEPAVNPDGNTDPVVAPVLGIENTGYDSNNRRQGQVVPLQAIVPLDATIFPGGAYSMGVVLIDKNGLIIDPENPNPNIDPDNVTIEVILSPSAHYFEYLKQQLEAATRDKITIRIFKIGDDVPKFENAVFPDTGTYVFASLDGTVPPIFTPKLVGDYWVFDIMLNASDAIINAGVSFNFAAMFAEGDIVIDGSEDEFFVEVNYDDEAVIRVPFPEVDHTGRIDLVKRDKALQHEFLANAEFDLYKADNGAFKKDDALKVNTAPIVTAGDAFGVPITHLDPGIYYLVETKAPSGYVLDPTPIKVEIKKQGTVVVTALNEKEPSNDGRFSFVKEDEGDSTKKLAGAVFDVYLFDPDNPNPATAADLDSSDKLIGQSIRTGSNGVGTSNYLPVGKYWLVETTAPTGYDLPKPVVPIPAEITTPGTTTPPIAASPIKNKRTDPKNGYFEINKYDSTNNDGSGGLTGTLINLPGAVFNVYKANAAGTGKADNVIRDTVGPTNPSGYAKSISLPAGYYVLEEVTFPAGYANENVPLIPVEVKADHGTAALTHLNVFNEATQGKFKVKKTDDNPTNPTTLGGALFDVYKTEAAAKQAISTGNRQSADFVTQLTGNGATSPWLPAGDYWLVEVKYPDGYGPVTPVVPLPVTVDAGVTTTEVTAQNKVKDGKVEAKKVDDEDNLLPGSKFSIFDTKANADAAKAAVAAGTYQGKNAPGYLGTIDGNGAPSSWLPPNTYWLVETEFPPGFGPGPDSGPFEFTITANATPVPVEVTNIGVSVSVKVKKTDDAASNPLNLTGSVFHVYNSKASAEAAIAAVAAGTYTASTRMPGFRFSLDGNGAASDWFTPGLSDEYWLIEAEYPPGYRPLDFTGMEPHDIKALLEAGLGKTITITKQNIPTHGYLKITKTDKINASNTGKILQGAEFAVYGETSGAIDKTKTTIYTATNPLRTDSTGTITSGLLPAGNYWLEETKAPDGYAVPDGSSAFVFGPVIVKADADISKPAQITVPNNPTHGYFTIRKTDGATPTPRLLPGAEFIVFGETGGTIDRTKTTIYNTSNTLKTNDSGEVVGGLLPAGNYWLVEVKAPAGFDEPDGSARYEFGPVEVTNNPNINAPRQPFTVTNDPTHGYLRILKKDSATGYGMRDVTFDVYTDSQGTVPLMDADGKPVFITTRYSGYAIYDGLLQRGTYWLVERVPANYNPAIPGPIEVEVVAGTTSTTAIAKEIFNDPINGYIEITKVEFGTRARKIGGAVFDIYNATIDSDGNPMKDADGNYILGTKVQTGLTTNTNQSSAYYGIATSIALPYGYYCLVETDATDGYIVDETPILVEVVGGITVKKEISNDYSNEKMPLEKKVLSGIDKASPVSELDAWKYFEELHLDKAKFSTVDVNGNMAGLDDHFIVYQLDINWDSMAGVELHNNGTDRAPSKVIDTIPQGLSLLEGNNVVGIFIERYEGIPRKLNPDGTMNTSGSGVSRTYLSGQLNGKNIPTYNNNIATPMSRFGVEVEYVTGSATDPGDKIAFTFGKSQSGYSTENNVGYKINIILEMKIAFDGANEDNPFTLGDTHAIDNTAHLTYWNGEKMGDTNSSITTNWYAASSAEISRKYNWDYDLEKYTEDPVIVIPGETTPSGKPYPDIVGNSIDLKYSISTIGIGMVTTFRSHIEDFNANGGVLVDSGVDKPYFTIRPDETKIADSSTWNWEVIDPAQYASYTNITRKFGNSSFALVPYQNYGVKGSTTIQDFNYSMRYPADILKWGTVIRNGVSLDSFLDVYIPIRFEMKKISDDIIPETLNGWEFGLFYADTREPVYDVRSGLPVVIDGDVNTEAFILPEDADIDNTGVEYTRDLYLMETVAPLGYEINENKEFPLTFALKTVNGKLTATLAPVGDDSGLEITEDGVTGSLTITAVNATIIPALSIEVRKDTIKRTAAAFDGQGANVTVDGQVINNVGVEKEHYRYDIDFRSTSNVDADEFVVIDPLEAVRDGLIKIEGLWSPATWGDMDGRMNVWYKSTKPSIGGGPILSGSPITALAPADQRYPVNASDRWKLWATIDQQTSPAFGPGGSGVMERERLYLPVDLAADDYITAIAFEYGAVKVGFTSKNYGDEVGGTDAQPMNKGLDGKDNGIRDTNGSLGYYGKTGQGGIVKINSPTLTSLSSTVPIEPAAFLFGFSQYQTMMAASNDFALMSGQISALDAGDIPIPGKGKTNDWSPVDGRRDYSADLAKLPTTMASSPLEPATYLVSALAPMQTTDIVSSVGAYIAVGGKGPRALYDHDQDAVLTREIVTFTSNPAPDPDVGRIVEGGSFLERANNIGITLRDGIWYDKNGRRVTARTGDVFMLDFLTILMIAALACIVLLLVTYFRTPSTSPATRRRKQTDFEAPKKGGY